MSLAINDFAAGQQNSSTSTRRNEVYYGISIPNSRFEDIRYSKNIHLHRLAEIITARIPDDSMPYKCFNKFIAERYGCSVRHASRLVAAGCDAKMWSISVNYNKMTGVRDRFFYLSTKTMERFEAKRSIISPMDMNAATYKSEALAGGHARYLSPGIRWLPSGDDEKLFNFENDAGFQGVSPRKRHHVKKKKFKDKDAAWKIARDFFGTKGYDYSVINGQVDKLINFLGNPEDVRMFFESARLDQDGRPRNRLKWWKQFIIEHDLP